MSRTLSQPKFFIIGIDSETFPTMVNKWSDSAQSKIYSVKILDWLQRINPIPDTSISNNNNFSYSDFAKLNNEQVQRFKIVEKQFSYALAPQKQELKAKYYQEHKFVKGASDYDFYYHNTQIYFLHKRDIEYLKSSIYK
jgi:hypothetical protein